MKIKGVLALGLLAVALTGCGSNMLVQPDSEKPWMMPQQYEDSSRMRKILSQAEQAPRAEAQPLAMAK